MCSLSEFQKTKILRVFDMLYDSNHDGAIEKGDFDLLLEKVYSTLDWQEGTSKYTEAKDTLDTVWKGLLEYADTNKDAKVTQEEWLHMWSDCLKDVEKDEFPDWQQKYMELMFNVNDKSGDKLIDREEYTTFFSQFGISEADCHVAFGLFSGGENISKKRFKALWKEYLTSNDESAQGNYLFGPSLNKL